MVNEAFGWAWMVLGVISGAWIGLGFRSEEHMGGYGSWRRRLVRLGHIAFFGTGILNVLFALGAERVALAAPWPMVASWALIAGAVLMSPVCFVSAFNKKAASLFFLPVLSLGAGILITAIGHVVGVLP